MSLKNRGRIGLVLDNKIVEWLRFENESTDVPISRIVEKAIKIQYEEKIEQYFKQKEGYEK